MLTNKVNKMEKLCKICKKPITGRWDKIYCGIRCKNYYHVNLRANTNIVAVKIDRILHRNRSILLELIGKRKSQIKINRLILDKKKFNFKYHTHLNTNSSGKTYYHLYDIAWMAFSDDEILIVKR